MKNEHTRRLYSMLSAEQRVAFFAMMSRVKRDPDLYAVLTWLVGLFGLNRWYLGQKGLCAIQIFLALLGATVLLLSVLIASIPGIILGVTFLGIVVGRWLYDLATQTRAIRYFVLRTETRCLTLLIEDQ